MDKYSEDFKTWMDERGLTAETIAPLIQKEEGTIRNWRSRGVPGRESVRSHVSAFMENYDLAKIDDAPLNALTLHLSQSQFDDWNRAAMKKGLIMREWAIEGLDSLAKNEPGAESESGRSVSYLREAPREGLLSEPETDFNGEDED